MNLNLIAENDLSFTLEDNVNGFGVNLIFTDENNKEYPVVMQTTDIGFFLDLQSGIGVTGRQVEVHGRIKTITELANDLPSRNWQVKYTDTNEKEWLCNIANVIPDRKLGIYRLILEAFNKYAIEN